MASIATKGLTPRSATGGLGLNSPTQEAKICVERMVITRRWVGTQENIWRSGKSGREKAKT